MILERSLDMLFTVILLAVLIVVAWAILKTRSGVRPDDDQWPLFAKPLLTARETEFYQRLESLYPEHRIFVQVALSQLLDVVPGTADRQAIRARFKQLVADFVLCRADLSVVAVIELDDASHLAADRLTADRRKTKAVESAGLRLVRIPAGPIPSAVELRQIIRAEQLELAPDAPAATPQSAQSLIDPDTASELRPVFMLVLVGVILVAALAMYPSISNSSLKERASLPTLPLPAPVLKPLPAMGTAVNATAIQAAERKRLEATQALEAQEAADAVAKRKEAAWAAYYQAPTACEHPPAWQDQVECGNQYIRAKREFEKRWESQVTASSAP